MVDAPRPETQLGDLEAAALTEEQVGGRYAGVVKRDVHVTVGGIVVAEHPHGVVDGDSRSVDGDEDLRLAAVGWPVGAGLDHGDHDLAAGVAGTRDVVLGAVDDPLVSVQHGSARDVLGVRGGQVGLGHGVGRPDLAVQ